MNKILDISNLSAGYENNPHIIKHISFSVSEKDFLGIIGPNGGGKTTLLRTIMGLLKPVEGRISFYNKEGKSVSKINIGYLPQLNKIDQKFPITVFDVILSGLSTGNRLPFLSLPSKFKLCVHEVAEQMGVDNLLNLPIGQLSGGQLQRVLLGRSIIDNPVLLILDEPISYVDKLFETNFYKILDEINDRMAIILVSHDIGTILSMVQNVLCVNESAHYHSGTEISQEWLNVAYHSCPFEIVGHGDVPHRVLRKH
ncbi:MAG: metal ABC transporter ATP-binding protein [Dysgonamonadaceae bacterium]|nr:metal ABC transporter ATP-binding protein [Dysgonamonadaceae bacterium]MDD4729877.1 metal ABC transporter ATP-binding protein [Dysgonamonadaceae bacterium]